MKLNTMTLMLIPVCAAMNIVGGQITAALKIPLFMDMIGTILAGMIAGPFAGMLTGIISNSINAISVPQYFPYVLTSIGVGLAAGFLSKRHMFSTVVKFVISALILTLISIVISAPITYFVFGGSSGGGASAITALLVASGSNIINAIFTTTIFTETGDKLIAAIVAILMVKSLPPRYLVQLPLGERYIKKTNKKIEL